MSRGVQLGPQVPPTSPAVHNIMYVVKTPDSQRWIIRPYISMYRSYRDESL